MIVVPRTLAGSGTTNVALNAAVARLLGSPGSMGDPQAVESITRRRRACRDYGKQPSA